MFKSDSSFSFFLSIIILIELIVFSFIPFDWIMYINLVNSLVLLGYVLVKLLNEIKAFYLALLGFSIFTFFDMFKSYHIIGLAESFDEFYVLTLYWEYISFLIFLLSYKLTKSKGSARIQKNYRLSKKKFFYIILPIGIVLLIVTVILTTHNPIILLISFFPKGITVVAFYYYLKKKKFVYLIITILFLVFSFSEISRRIYITLFIILLTLFTSYLYQKYSIISKKRKFVFLALFLLMVLFMGFLRSDKTGTMDSVEGSKFSRSINNLAEMRAIDTYDNTAFIIRNFPNQYDLYYGETYLAIFVQFIPRSLWPEKIVSLGAPLGLLRKEGIRDWDVHKWKQYVNNHSYSPGLQGEAYANFGFFGIVILSLLFGRFVKIFDTRINSRFVMMNIKTIPYLAFYSSFFLVSRGDLLMATYYSLLFFIFLKLMFKVLSIK